MNTALVEVRPAEPAPPEPLMLARQVADWLGMSSRWVMNKAANGDIPSVRLPGSNRVRFRRSEVEASLQRMNVISEAHA
jgi:excisionase family DNA binding protein